MILTDLSKYELCYLGTPYSKYPTGIEAAFIEACRLTAVLLKSGIKVYSPIAHTHPIAIHGNLDPLDHAIWMPFDKAIMGKSDALIVGQLEGWESSKGLAYEIEYFEGAGKPIYSLNPRSFEITYVR